MDKVAWQKIANFDTFSTFCHFLSLLATATLYIFKDKGYFLPLSLCPFKKIRDTYKPLFATATLSIFKNEGLKQTKWQKWTVPLNAASDEFMYERKIKY